MSLVLDYTCRQAAEKTKMKVKISKNHPNPNLANATGETVQDLGLYSIVNVCGNLWRIKWFFLTEIA